MLFPRYFKWIGWVLFVPGLILSVLMRFRYYSIPFLANHSDKVRVLPLEEDGYTDEVAVIMLMAGLLFIVFTKQKNESELVQKIRLHALYQSATLTWALACLFLLISFCGELIKAKSGWAIIIGYLNSFFMYSFIIPLFIFIPWFYYLYYQVKDEQELKQGYRLPCKPFNIIAKIIVSICFLLLLGSQISPFFYLFLNDTAVVIPFAFLLLISTNERLENQLTHKLRLKAIGISFQLHILLFVVCYWCFYGWYYATEIFPYSVMSAQIIFIIVFQWMYFKYARQTENTGPISAL